MTLQTASPTQKPQRAETRPKLPRTHPHTCPPSEDNAYDNNWKHILVARHHGGKFFWCGRHLAKLFLVCAFGGWAYVDTTGVMARIRWLRGRPSVLGYHLRDWALTNRALVKRDFEAFVIEKADPPLRRGGAGGTQTRRIQESDS